MNTEEKAGYRFAVVRLFAFFSRSVPSLAPVRKIEATPRPHGFGQSGIFEYETRTCRQLDFALWDYRTDAVVTIC